MRFQPRRGLPRRDRSRTGPRPRNRADALRRHSSSSRTAEGSSRRRSSGPRSQGDDASRLRAPPPRASSGSRSSPSVPPRKRSPRATRLTRRRTLCGRVARARAPRDGVPRARRTVPLAGAGGAGSPAAVARRRRSRPGSCPPGNEASLRRARPSGSASGGCAWPISTKSRRLMRRAGSRRSAKRRAAPIAANVSREARRPSFCSGTSARGRAASATSRPESRAPVDPLEPFRVAAAVREMGLDFVVLTSVDRDDLPDGGAAHFAAAIAAVRRLEPAPGVEVLTPDFRGRFGSLRVVVEAAPDVFNHNVETVPRLYARVRRGARFERSLALLSAAKVLRARPDDEVRFHAGTRGEARRGAWSSSADSRGRTSTS